MFRIGEFSRITGLTVKTLRFYHEKGLLTPAWVDEQTADRYYNGRQADKARVITQLRALEFPLEQIGQMLAGHEDEADVLDFLEKQKALLADKVRQYRAVVVSLEKLIRQEKEARLAMQNSTFEVGEKVLEPLLVAGIRMKGRYADCGKGFARIGRSLGRNVSGKCFLLHYDSEYREEDADFEACMPLRKGKEAPGISVRELPGGRCVWMLHKGPYEELGRSYAKVLEYVKAKGYEIVLPTREVYLKGPGMIFRGNPKNYLTEIQMPIRDGAS
jgi:DNA-binding transcriptional MerR regulator/effector-binding domain-containing protein